MGWDAALHVAEIHAWIVAAFEPSGVRYGPRLNRSSLYVIVPDATKFPPVKAFEANTFPGIWSDAPSPVDVLIPTAPD